jgi:mannan endo-1,4-beta-mannosidase
MAALFQKRLGMDGMRRNSFWDWLASLAFAVVSLCSTANAQTANPNASPDARRLLAYLAALPSRPDHPVISGQTLGAVDGYGLGPDDDMSAGYRNYVEKLREETGKVIGLIGVNFGRLPGCSIRSPLIPTSISPFMNCDGSTPNYTKDVDILARHWRAGGLVTVMWHVPNPWNGGGAHDIRIGGDFASLDRRGNLLYDTWHKMLDELALGLQLLQNQGVVVLFRPFHEQDGDWFWWGDHGPEGHPTAEEFVALWRNTFDYLTNEKKLNNLLWVFSVNRGDPWGNILAFDPGSQYYDILGLDYYEDEKERDVDFSALLQRGKPIAITEFGPMDYYAAKNAAHPNYDFLRIFRLRDRFPHFSYFMAWHGTHSPQAIIQNPNARELLLRHDILNVGDINWRN